MKLKLGISALFLSFFAVSCSGPKATQKTVDQFYENTKFSPESALKSTSSEVDILVKPIDAASINAESFDLASLDGNYEKEIAIAISKQKEEINNLPKKERNVISAKIKAIETIDEMYRKKEISKEASFLLKERIWYGPDKGRDGSEISSISNSNISTDQFNPYKINNQYLSVFKLSFENKSDVVKKISLKDFQVISGYEQLYPLELKYFEENLKSDPAKIKNVLRMNMPAELVLTPGQKISKYISVPPINSKNNQVTVQYIQGDKYLNFDFDLKQESISKSFILDTYKFYIKGVSEPSTYLIYYSVEFDGYTPFATKGSFIYVEQSKKYKPAKIKIIAVNKLNQKVKIASKVNYNFGDAKNGKVVFILNDN